MDLVGPGERSIFFHNSVYSWSILNDPFTFSPLCLKSSPSSSFSVDDLASCFVVKLKQSEEVQTFVVMFKHNCFTMFCQFPL